MKQMIYVAPLVDVVFQGMMSMRKCVHITVQIVEPDCYTERRRRFEDNFVNLDWCYFDAKAWCFRNRIGFSCSIYCFRIHNLKC